MQWQTELIPEADERQYINEQAKENAFKKHAKHKSPGPNIQNRIKDNSRYALQESNSKHTNRTPVYLSTSKGIE